LFFLQGFAESVLCSHLFSVYTFIDSIKNVNCRYLSFECNSTEELIQNDQCYQNKRNEMGIRASPLSEGTFYLTTQDANKFPFCRLFTKEDH
jgi:hypothetical protein